MEGFPGSGDHTNGVHPRMGGCGAGYPEGYNDYYPQNGSPACAYRPPTTTQHGPKTQTVYVEIYRSPDKLKDIVRIFRERGSYKIKSIQKLFNKLCDALDIPLVEKNRPKVVFMQDDTHLGFYECTDKEKIISIHRPRDLKLLLSLWHLYLLSRNKRFSIEKVFLNKGNIKTSHTASLNYAKDIIKLSEPKEVRCQEKRRFLIYEDF